jgi:hypothetical protein
LALTLRPTGLGHGVYKDSIDYSVFAGAWNVGRERRGVSDARLIVPLHAPGGRETLRASNRVPTLEMAKAEFEASWRQWLAWAKLGERE